jgi:4-hydroxy-3-methylbut-2-enyl diphosphate reductase
MKTLNFPPQNKGRDSCSDSPCRGTEKFFQTLNVKEVKVYNTICNSTALRLKETANMARKVDVMIVVGGKNSANTTQLSHLCTSLSVRTYHIETEEELKKEWFKDTQNIGITAGASTPDWIIKKVEKRIIDIGGESRNGN